MTHMCNNIYNIRILVGLNQDDNLCPIRRDNSINNLYEYTITIQPNGFIQEGSKYKRGLGPYYRINKDDSLIKNNDNCPICLEFYKVGEYKRTLSCNHTYHKKCVDRWIKSNDKFCPICRQYHNHLTLDPK